MARRVKLSRTPTAEDVAQLAGVSRSAVSRTFTEGASVAPATREKVLAAARSLGYRVNFLARSLSHQRTNLVGLVVSDLDNSFRAQLLDALGRCLVSVGYRPFLLPTQLGEDVSPHIDMMLHYNVSGAIVTNDGSPAEIAQECAAYGVPLVLINKPFVSEKVANVCHDTQKAGRLAARKFREIGCRRVALASQRRRSHSIALRRRAFLEECSNLGMEIAAEFFGDVQNYVGGRKAAEAFLASGIAADGIYCANDYLALGFIDTLHNRSAIVVPRDLKVIACDDIAEADWLGYDITTVRQDPAALAEAAVSSLIQRITEPDAPAENRTIDVHLVERGSTARA